MGPVWSFVNLEWPLVGYGHTSAPPAQKNDLVLHTKRPSPLANSPRPPPHTGLPLRVPASPVRENAPSLISRESRGPSPPYMVIRCIR
jgi:hypothetical protein